jgi:hypothetical protein
MYTRNILSFALVAICFTFLIAPETLMAIQLKQPSFINSVDTDKLEEAGSEINTWIFAGIAVVIGLFSVRPGYLFITGKPDEALEKSKEIIVGVILAMVLGGIAFAVAANLGS